MSIPYPKIIFLILWICIDPLHKGFCAERLFIWLHGDGEKDIRITNQPPPENAKILDIIRYHPLPRKSPEELEQQAKQEKLDQENKAVIERIQTARKRADEARKIAEEAKRTAATARDIADEPPFTRFSRWTPNCARWSFERNRT